MKLALRLLAGAFALAMCSLYVLTGLNAKSTIGWTNAWMGPAMISVMLLVAAFVLTARRAGTRGSVLSDLGSALHRPRFTDPVPGIAQVVTASGLPRSGQNAGSAMCEMHLVVTIPGRPSVAASCANIVPLAKWPTPGTQLPVVAEREDPSTFVISWEKVGTGWDAGAAQAQALAERMNSGGSEPMPDPAAGAPGVGAPGVPLPPGTPRIVSSSVTINGRPATPDEIAAYEALTGMDLDGDGNIHRS